MAAVSPSVRSTARPTVVLACAERDAPRLTPVVRAIVAQGARVELVPGVDRNVRALETVVEAHGSRALYVLCHSEALDRYQADLLELTVRAGEVGDRRLVSAWFDPADVGSLIATVARRLEELAGPKPAAHAANGPPGVGLTPAYAVGDASASTSVPATTLIATRAALGFRRYWTALGIVLLVAGVTAAVVYLALGPEAVASFLESIR